MPILLFALAWWLLRNAMPVLACLVAAAAWYELDNDTKQPELD